MVLAVVFAVSTFALIYFVDSYTTGTGKSVAQLVSWVNTIFGICVVGVQINAWLAFFNLIPFGAFDGYKVFPVEQKGMDYCFYYLNCTLHFNLLGADQIIEITIIPETGYLSRTYVCTKKDSGNQQRVEYYPFFNCSVNRGTTLKRSPRIP